MIRAFALLSLLLWPLYLYSDEIAPMVAPFIYAIYGGGA